MDPICDKCRKVIKPTDVKECKTCKSVSYCSDACLSSHTNAVCKKPSEYLQDATVKQFLLNEPESTVPYNGKKLFRIPGPIKGPMPAAFYTIDVDGSPGNLAFNHLKAKGYDMSRTYYLIDTEKLAKAFWMDWTTEQRNEFAYLIQKNAIEMDKKGVRQKKKEKTPYV